MIFFVSFITFDIHHESLAICEIIYLVIKLVCSLADGGWYEELTGNIKDICESTNFWISNSIFYKLIKWEYHTAIDKS